MEKYGEYRDSGTGIGPFLPVLIPVNVKPGVFDKTVLYVKLVIKIIIALPILTVYQIVPIKIILDFLFKILVGFKANVQVEGVKKSKVSPTQHYPKKNEIYFCNYTNPLDFWFLSQLSQNNKFVVLVAFSRDHVVEFSNNSWWSFALFTLITTGILPPKASGKGRGFEIVKVDKNINQRYKDKIVYCFPEGTTSNGKSVLPFELDCKLLSSNIKTTTSTAVNSVQLKVTPGFMVTPLPYESMNSTSYWFKLLFYSSLNSGVECKYKISHEVAVADVRTKLNNDDKYKLIGNSLNKSKKKKFIEIYKGPI